MCHHCKDNKEFEILRLSQKGRELKLWEDTLCTNCEAFIVSGWVPLDSISHFLVE